MRVPLGFIVEGVCEFQSFESIVRKGISASHGRLPVVNAWGNGGLRKRLEEHLTAVTRVNHPVVVIVALDLRDALAEGKHADCAQLRADLQARAGAWLGSVQDNVKLVPLPEKIVVVIQTPVFEAWLTADPVGLQQCTRRKSVRHGYTNVDDEIVSHRAWLNEHVSGGYTKSPVQVHRMAKCLHPARMAEQSRSFAKFWKEVLSAYHAWAAETGSEFTRHAA